MSFEPGFVEYLKRIVALVVACAFFDAQCAPAFADQITNTAQQTQVWGQSIVPQSMPGTMDSSGNMTFNPGTTQQQTMTPQQLFGSSASMSTVTSSRSQYGTNVGLTTSGTAAEQQLNSTPNTPNGMAYAVGLGSLQLAKPSLTNDPVFSQTNQIFSDWNAAAATFGSCQTSTSYNNTTTSNHVPDYKHCVSVNATNQKYTVEHDYNYPPPPPLLNSLVVTGASGSCVVSTSGTSSTSVNFVMTHCGNQNITFSLNGGGTFSYIHEQNTDGGYNEYYVNGGWIGGYTTGHFGNTGADAALSVGSFTANYTSRNDGVPVTGYLNGSVPYNPLVTDTWTPPEYVNIIANPDSFCKESTPTCTIMPATDSNGCATVGGSYVCPSQMTASPFAGISPLCQSVSASMDCTSFDQGQMPCWTDVQGIQRCPTVSTTAQTTCDQYANNPKCGYISSKCVDGATGESGTCYMLDETYDCGYNVDVSTVTKDQTSSCSGTVRCMGTECTNPTGQQSTDFAKAAALLQAMQHINMDTSCASSDPSTCQVFTGTAESCKKAMGGYVDCCTGAPTAGVSLFQYLQMVRDVQTIGSSLYTLDHANIIGSAYNDISSSLTDAQSAIEKPFVEAWNDITGSQASDMAEQGIIEGFEQEMETNIAQWGEQVFGPEAMNAVFQVTPIGTDAAGSPMAAGDAFSTTTVETTTTAADGTITTTTVESTTMETGVISLAPALASALSIIGLVYAIYSITTMIIQMVYACEPSELKLQTFEVLKECHYLGTYCAQGVLGVCIEQKESYCCYNTPLGRILQEQIRPQEGLSFGTAKSPNCSGLTVGNLQAANWDKIDLSEWIGILSANGQLPNADTLSAQITGANSVLNVTGSRQDVISRTQTMYGSVSSTAVRQSSANSVEGGISLPGSP